MVGLLIHFLQDENTKSDEDENHFDTAETVEKKFSAKKLKKEKENAFKILESITGKPIRKMKSESESKIAG